MDPGTSVSYEDEVSYVLHVFSLNPQRPSPTSSVCSIPHHLLTYILYTSSCIRLPPGLIADSPIDFSSPREPDPQGAPHLARLHNFDDRLRLVWRRCAEERITVPQVRGTGCRWVRWRVSWSDNPESAVGVGIGRRRVTGRGQRNVESGGGTSNRSRTARTRNRGKIT
jgi:hypothetical protein